MKKNFSFPLVLFLLTIAGAASAQGLRLENIEEGYHNEAFKKVLLDVLPINYRCEPLRRYAGREVNFELPAIEAPRSILNKIPSIIRDLLRNPSATSSLLGSVVVLEGVETRKDKINLFLRDISRKEGAKGAYWDVEFLLTPNSEEVASIELNRWNVEHKYFNIGSLRSPELILTDVEALDYEVECKL